MKRWPRNLRIGSALVTALLAWLLWQFSPLQPIVAVANLSDPSKLATLGPRGANPRLNKIVYWLHQADAHFIPPKTTIGWAQTLTWTKEPRASLVKESLLHNMEIADRLGLFTRENLDRLRHGKAGHITKGPYVPLPVEIDHIVPFSLAPEAGNELANLEMLPEPLNRRKSNRVGERQLAHAQRLFKAGLISADTLARVESAESPRN